MDWDEQEARRGERSAEQPRRRKTERTRTRSSASSRKGQKQRPPQERQRSPSGTARRTSESDKHPRQPESRREAGGTGEKARSAKPEQRRSAGRDAKPAERARTPERKTRETPHRPAERRKQEKVKKRRQEARRTPPKTLPRRRLMWKLLTTAAVVLALALGVTIFFKVQNVNITGNEKYTAEAIFEASGIEKGENLLTFGKPRAAGRILAELPYVSQVQIGIKLPNTVNIDIVELEVTYSIRAADGAWWLMDFAGKLLEPVEDGEAAKHTQVLGVRAGNPVIGQCFAPADASETGQSGEETDATAEQTQNTEDTALTASASERAAAALQILAALEETDHMGEVTVVDVSSLYDIQLWYGQQYQVRLGGPVDLGYKVRYMTEAVSRLEDYQSGVLDLTFQEDRTARFTPW